MKRKSIWIRIAAVILVALMLLGSAAVIIIYAEDGASLGSAYLEDGGLIFEADPYEPIPLLVIKISFDANGNGINDYDPNNSTALWGDKNSPLYGEQYCYSTDQEWAKALFGETGKTLLNYYKQISDGSFWFYPAAETSGEAGDGIVSVTVHQKHPDAVFGHTSSSQTKWSGERALAIRAADEYVDFASFDKNGNGILETEELAIVFVAGGTEMSNGWNGDAKKYFLNHAHYTTGSGIKADGVSVASGAMGFVRVGEYSAADKIIPVGTVAHELGHFLGAIDLYDTGSNGRYSNMVGSLSLMASGSHGSQTGERSGTSPIHMDPFHLIQLGFNGYTVATNGEYTLHSRQKGPGNYNILRVNTPNPNEYYLIENRYHNDSINYFDAIYGKDAGILIWHVDESVSTGNNSDKGNEPVVAVLGTSSLGYGGVTAFRGDATAPENMKVFDSTGYKFPVGKTWYTSLTPEQAESAGFRVEVLSPLGFDMTVRVTSSFTAGPYMNYTVTDKTTDGFIVSAAIKTLNGGALSACGFIISGSSSVTFEEGEKVYCTPDENGRFSYTATGLSEGKKYYIIAFAESDLGLSVYHTSATTLVTPKPKEYATFYLCQNISSRGGFFGVKCYPGNTLTYSLQMKKTNYEFGGWYFDEDFSGERYDMATVKTDTDDVYLYAKWIDKEDAATMKLMNATAKYPYYAAEVGDTFLPPVPTEKAGYRFDGWFEDEECTAPFDFEKSVEEAEEISLWAKWTPETSVPGTDGTTSGSTDTATTAASTDTSTVETGVTSTTSSTEGTGEDEPRTPSKAEKVLGTMIVILIFGGAAVFFSVRRIIQYRKTRY